EGPAGLAWMSCSGWSSPIGALPEASSSQLVNRWKYCGKASDPTERRAPPVRASVPSARPRPRSMRPGASASNSMNTSATLTGERSRTERITGSVVQVGPGVRSVEPANLDGVPVEIVDQPRVYGHSMLCAIEALPVGGAAAGLATVEGQHPVPPDIRLRGTGL